MIDNELLSILVCPKCRGTVEYQPSPDQQNGELVCPACRLRYMIVDDIPNLIIEDALPIEENEAN